jgi:hypothetical protein
MKGKVRGEVFIRKWEGKGAGVWSAMGRDRGDR